MRRNGLRFAVDGRLVVDETAEVFQSACFGELIWVDGEGFCWDEELRIQNGFRNMIKCVLNMTPRFTPGCQLVLHLCTASLIHTVQCFLLIE